MKFLLAIICALLLFSASELQAQCSGGACRVLTAPVRVVAQVQPVRRVARGVVRVQPLRTAARLAVRPFVWLRCR